MFVFDNVYLLLKISKLFVKSIYLLRDGEKTGDHCALTIIKKTYDQFNSGIHPYCDTYYLFLRMGSFEFVTHQRPVTFAFV